MADAMSTRLPVYLLRDPAGLIARKSRIWGEDDNAVAGPDIHKRVGRIDPALVKGEPKWRWLLRPERAPRPSNGRPVRRRKQRRR